MTSHRRLSSRVDSGPIDGHTRWPTVGLRPPNMSSGLWPAAFGDLDNRYRLRCIDCSNWRRVGSSRDRRTPTAVFVDNVRHPLSKLNTGRYERAGHQREDGLGEATRRQRQVAGLHAGTKSDYPIDERSPAPVEAQAGRGEEIDPLGERTDRVPVGSTQVVGLLATYAYKL